MTQTRESQTIYSLVGDHARRVRVGRGSRLGASLFRAVLTLAKPCANHSY